MTVRIYGIRNCDTMKKALRWLDRQGIDYEFLDYKQPGVIAAHLPNWMQRAGWRVLLNTRGLMWRKLDEADRTDMNASKATQLMQAYPVLVKRPVLDTGTRLEIGFDPARYAEIFGQHPASQEDLT